ncbi:MAG: hypothetical protein P4L69_07135 [Desulfosporosinus sp.]|nr:hypothetical protein [Desulfosporosinus sp.]
MTTPVPVAAPQKVKTNVKEFVRLDDGLKKARLEMKETRKAMYECRDQIIDYMREAEIERLGVKKGSQFIELVEKDLKIRPSAECVKATIQELVDKGVTDPMTLYDAISKCGGTKHVWKLSRKTKRAATKRKEPEPGAPGEEEPKKKKKKKVIVDSGV